MKLVNTLLLVLVLFTSGVLGAQSVEKPEIIRFGTGYMEMLDILKDNSTAQTPHVIENIQLPTARESQKQIDCEGFMYAGKPRKAEFVFADDVLDMVWILTEADEEEGFIEKFTAMFGKPTHEMDDVTFFLDDGVAVRNSPHEVLFISDRLKEPYRQWLNN